MFVFVPTQSWHHLSSTHGCPRKKSFCLNLLFRIAYVKERHSLCLFAHIKKTFAGSFAGSFGQTHAVGLVELTNLFVRWFIPRLTIQAWKRESHINVIGRFGQRRLLMTTWLVTWENKSWAIRQGQWCKNRPANKHKSADRPTDRPTNHPTNQLTDRHSEV